MKSIGPLYVDLVKYPTRKFLPVFEHGWSNEIEEPFRRGVCWVFRFPFTKLGYVIGIWKEKQEELDALISAIMARQIKLEDADFETI